ncbi:hypothetical protein L3X38_018525 [Prunus dulcis]|uniref:Uncharacterized protein n=1 Tax=Prunus dulcis TaxID=3755 RepID=A0AAD4WA63_PRUDU|nr:hypothetical protein L3X38_018525 [Prunus dulcis]
MHPHSSSSSSSSTPSRLRRRFPRMQTSPTAPKPSTAARFETSRTRSPGCPARPTAASRSSISTAPLDLDLHRQGLQLNYEIRVLRLQRERRHGRVHFLRLQFDDHYAEARELVPLHQSGFQRLLLLDRAGSDGPDYEHFQL